jgi:hypothetical protein
MLAARTGVGSRGPEAARWSSPAGDFSRLILTHRRSWISPNNSGGSAPTERDPCKTPGCPSHVLHKHRRVPGRHRSALVFSEKLVLRCAIGARGGLSAQVPSGRLRLRNAIVARPASSLGGARAGDRRVGRPDPCRGGDRCVGAVRRALVSAPWATTVDLAPVAYPRQHLDEERFDAVGPLAAPIEAPTVRSPPSACSICRRSPTHITCTPGPTGYAAAEPNDVPAGVPEPDTRIYPA